MLPREVGQARDRVERGEVLELMPVNEEMVYRIEAPRGIVSRIEQIDPVTKKIKREQEDVWVFPAKHFILAEPTRLKAIKRIRDELKERLDLSAVNLLQNPNSAEEHDHPNK
ncbi:hypothetical protein FBQ97_15145 [Acidobacteria bacterium ACD]|nr:hypothetical protein [Acidobacteria bacterium ACD]